ncbi:MAG TPA: VWA domain-containing protein [Acidimicrobiales bacterium]|nr:VWA domain-containing protein [Acidimicrobiales bacterium]
MSFIWPGMLVLLLAVPLIVGGYVSLARRRAQRTQALAAQGFAPTGSGRRLRRLRHVPFAFFLVAFVLLLVSFARPEVSFSLPHKEGTVILAFDVSNSMRATDLQPTRIDAAKAAAHTFVDKQPKSIKIGVVAFSDGGLVTQEPTDVRADVLSAIDRLTPQGATSLGQGIFTALNAIAGKPIKADLNSLDSDASNVEIGYFSSAAIVLFSDGQNTTSPDPIQVARLASVAGVHIYPIGIGSPNGTVVKVNGFSEATALDEPTLTQIATVTNGTYFNAQDSQTLADISKKIDLKSTSDGKKTEVTGLVTGISALLLVMGGALSLVWFGRLV